METICTIHQPKEDIQNKLLYGGVMVEAGSLPSTSASRASPCGVHNGRRSNRKRSSL